MRVSLGLGGRVGLGRRSGGGGRGSLGVGTSLGFDGRFRRVMVMSLRLAVSWGSRGSGVRLGLSAELGGLCGSLVVVLLGGSGWFSWERVRWNVGVGRSWLVWSIAVSIGGRSKWLGLADTVIVVRSTKEKSVGSFNSTFPRFWSVVEVGSLEN